MMGRRNKGGRRNIPEGWIGCPPMATGFVDDRFFVFKTPLKPELNYAVPPSDRFSHGDIFKRIRQMNNSNIGLWIDLTNTSRYYNPETICNLGIQYEKLSCEGHGRPPSPQSVREFCYKVHRFFRRNSRDYVGVHCTHGFNRTGFLICSYLIQYRRYSAEEAVQEFAKYRDPGIYRQNYVDELYRMSTPRLQPIRVSQPSWLQLQSNNNVATPSSNGLQNTATSADQGEGTNGNGEGVGPSSSKDPDIASTSNCFPVPISVNVTALIPQSLSQSLVPA